MKEQNLFNEDWDICIILDACRYDTFKQENTIKGELEPRRSPNSCTQHWVRDAFPNSPQQDIVYLSANPYISNKTLKSLGKPIPYFYAIFNIWDLGWDKTLATVSPDDVNYEVFKHIGNYNNKRYIIHYMQPHYPFIGSKYHDGTGWGIVNHAVPVSTEPPPNTIWTKLEKGEISAKEVKGYYTDNLKFVLSYVKKVVNKYHRSRKIVITSDHGECFGEYGLSNHPCDQTVDELTVVPWFVGG